MNPWHLDAKPIGENTLASHSNPMTINKAKTHCIHGHEFTPENTYITPSGRRNCRRCRSESSRRHLEQD